MLFYPVSSAVNDIHIDDNIFDSCYVGINAYGTVALSNGDIKGNTFMNISEKDILGDFGGYVVLSSVFVDGNTYDQGVLNWYSVGTEPTTGTWKAGDTILNVDPSAGQTLSWVCTVAGTPGIWIAQ